MLVDAPVARLPFHGMLRAVTWLPVWLQVADQPCVRRCALFGKANPSSQELIGSPVFLMVTLAVKPVLHWLVAYTTSQEVAAWAMPTGTATAPPTHQRAGGQHGHPALSSSELHCWSVSSRTRPGASGGLRAEPGRLRVGASRAATTLRRGS